MPISEGDRVRVRHHMGYHNVGTAQTFQLGLPKATQIDFMIEGAMNVVLESAYPKLYQLLDRLDCIECEVFGGSDLADIDSMGEIKVNRKRLSELAQYYKIAQQALANLLGVIPNFWDQRTWLGGGGVINVPVG
jgi:hypothetical protein